MKKYYTYTVKKLITVQHIVTIEYLRVGRDFFYPEESHAFYEFVYVDKGTIACKTDGKKIKLSENDIYLIPPQMCHCYMSGEAAKAEVLVVCFKSKSNIIPIVKGINHPDTEIKELIKKIIKEARETFVFPFDEKLTLNENPKLGSQQLIENYIEEVLIKLVQEATYNNKNVKISANASAAKSSVVNEVVKMLEKNIYGKITLSDISGHMFYSKTYLNGVFKEIKGTTIKQYYQDIKIKEAKALLDKKESIASISEKLCFESPQHFAKVFKAKVGKTPTEYKKALQ